MERRRKQFKQARRTKKSRRGWIFLHIFAKNKYTTKHNFYWLRKANNIKLNHK